MPKQLFGTDGIRGTPGSYPLDDRTLYWAGRALGEYLRAAEAAPTVLIGADTRESGPHIAGQIARGLAAAGARPVYAGVLTTPGVAYLVRAENFSAGVVISASHNPYTDNGIKLIARTGMKFPDAIEEALEQYILARQQQPPPAGPEARLELQPGLGKAYLEFLAGRVPAGAKFAGMKIVLDCANGAASALGPELFRALGAEVEAIFHTPDGRNINAGCGSLHPEALREKVAATGAALGAAFDGDADRAIFASASGRIINGDGTLLVAARWMKSAGTLKGGVVVGTTMANLGLELALQAEGLRLERVPVGDRYVLEGMQRLGANLGGEQSGHIIFLDDHTTGDGLLTALKMASLVALCGPLDQLVAGLKIFPQTILNVPVREKPPLETLPEVAQALAEAERALGTRGRIVLRYSGTEPLARVMVEAERAADVERFSRAIAEAIRACIGTR
jgi:phosphoglucosamine mutase